MREPGFAYALLATVALAACGAIVDVGSATDFDTEVLPYLERNCIRCHGPTKQRAELRLDTLSRDLQTGSDAWLEVIERIKAGEMPPRDLPPAGESAVGADQCR